MRAIDLTGKVFGLLTVVRFDSCRQMGRATRRFWLCRCECGQEVSVFAGNLRSGNSESCGCRKFDGFAGRPTHQQSGTFEHRVWKNMRRRCNATTCRTYKHYGGRGIKVCERWDSFENFLADMGPAPSKKHSIERKDSNGNYEPDNCVWLIRTKQSRNRRDTIRVTFQGETRALVEWAEHLGLPYSALKKRHYDGWDIERMLKTPVRQMS